MSVFMYTYVLQTRIDMYIHTCMYTFVLTCVFLCIHVHIYICICIFYLYIREIGQYIYICIYIGIWRAKWRKRGRGTRDWTMPSLMVFLSSPWDGNRFFILFIFILFFIFIRMGTVEYVCVCVWCVVCVSGVWVHVCVHNHTLVNPHQYTHRTRRS